MNTSMRAAVAFLGGSVQNTGGNCTAIVFDHGDSETLVTSVVEELTAPVSLDERVLVGTYDKATGDEIDPAREFLTLRIALLDLYGPVKGERMPRALHCLYNPRLSRNADFVHFGKHAFRVTARFPDTLAGRRDANKYIIERTGEGVFAVEHGEIIVAEIDPFKGAR